MKKIRGFNVTWECPGVSGRWSVACGSDRWGKGGVVGGTHVRRTTCVQAVRVLRRVRAGPPVRCWVYPWPTYRDTALIGRWGGVAES